MYKEARGIQRGVEGDRVTKFEVINGEVLLPEDKVIFTFDYELGEKLVIEKSDKIYIKILGEEQGIFLLDTYDIDREIMDIFYCGFGSHGPYELIVVTRIGNENIIEVYQEENEFGQDGNYIPVKVNSLSNYLTKLFRDKEKVREDELTSILQVIYPINYNSLDEFLKDKDNSFFSGIDLFQGSFVDEVIAKKAIEEKEGYYVTFEEGIYGYIEFTHYEEYMLEEVFEGRVEGREVVRDGRVEKSEDGLYYRGFYKENQIDGQWSIDGKVFRIFDRGRIVKDIR